MMENKQEEKVVDDEIDISICEATRTYSPDRQLTYIEKETTLTEEHLKMFNELRLYVDSVLSKKQEWVLANLEAELLSLVPNENEQKEADAPTITQGTAASTEKQYAPQELYVYLSRYATESTLLRAITGSDYRLEVARVSVLETVQWRVTSKVDFISPDMFEDSINLNLIYCMNERDKKGHAISYLKLGENPPKDPWQIVRAAIWTIEKSIKLADQKGLHQITWLLDITHLKYATVPPMAILKQIAHIMQHYYPERLNRAYVCFSPWVFRMVWKMVSGLLTENTKGKIIVASWDDSSAYQTFAERIDKESLDKKFGGLLESKYSYQWEIDAYEKNNKYAKSST